MSIAIGITTTLERAAEFQYCLTYWERYLPPNAKIHVYIDIELQGISTAKNKVLSMCDYADHIIMADDDIYPVVDGWWLPYTESGLNHACWNFDRKVIDNTNQIYDVLETPNGCLLYFSKMAIEICGGWSYEFTGWSYEHVNVSDVIFNNGLTPSRYIDVANTKHLFKMVACESSVPSHIKAISIPRNYELYQQKFYSKEFKPFK